MSDKKEFPKTSKFYMSTFYSPYLTVYEINGFRNRSAAMNTSEEGCIQIQREAEALIEERKKAR